MEINREKLLYLLNNMDDHIVDLIENVLSDSKVDPHFSAVTATNRIKCYIHIMLELGEELPYSNVREFFKFNAFTNEEYNNFEENRKKESKYYRGIQY